jgi:hypothetical protein
MIIFYHQSFDNFSDKWKFCDVSMVIYRFGEFLFGEIRFGENRFGEKI